MADALPDFEHECFLIAPIGEDDSEIRRRSDGVRDFVVKPAVAELGLSVVRADDLLKPGQITLQVIEHVLSSKAVVADLTGRNPNVYYELAVRHTARLPVVLIVEESDFDSLPFDIQQMRVIKLCSTDLASAAHAQAQITAHLREALAGEVDSPIATVLNLQALEAGTSVEKVLADLVLQVQNLGGQVDGLRQQVAATQDGMTHAPAEHQRVPRSIARLRRLLEANNVPVNDINPMSGGTELVVDVPLPDRREISFLVDVGEGTLEELRGEANEVAEIYRSEIASSATEE